MWYFAWILGVLLAASLGIINVMWLEVNIMIDEAEEMENKLSEKSRAKPRLKQGKKSLRYKLLSTLKKLY